MTMSSQTAVFETTGETTGLSLSPIARPVLFVLGIGVLLSPFALNDSLIALAFATLFAVVALTWQAEGPPVALLICGVQWLQGSLKLFDAELRGVELWTTSASKSIAQASALTMLWTVALAFGIRLGLRRVKIAREQALPSVGVALVIYAAYSLLIPLLALVASASMRQVVVALANVRWAAVYALCICVLSARRGLMVLAVVLVVELAFGFLSFFSSFKTVMIVFALALLARNRSFSLRQMLAAAATVVAAVYLGILWTAIKGEYRTALNDGAGDQSIRIGAEEQATELNRLVRGVDQSRFDRAIDRFVDRVGYVEYFAFALDYVPRVRPHEDGRLWWAAIEHVVMPRVLFPDKAPLPSDTEVAERYTGLRLSNNRVGTSIALGLPAETYVDFGAVLLLAVPVGLGLLYGLVFRLLLTRRKYAPYGAGLAVSVAYSHMLLELSPSKVLGSLLSISIIAVIIWYTLLGWSLRVASRLTSGSEPQPPRPRSLTRVQ